MAFVFFIFCIYLENKYKWFDRVIINYYYSTVNPIRMLPILRLVVEDPELKAYYEPRVQEHNTKVYKDPCPDSGFDLCVANEISVKTGGKSTKVDLQVKASMVEDDVPVGYYTYARSSISKTPLLLANNVGIIDSGYRGNLIAMFRNLEPDDYTIAKQTRMIQICHSTLKPFLVELVDNVEALGTSTRGSGGFGSTGET